MNKIPGAPRRKPLYLILALGLFCVVIGIAAWTTTSSPALSLNGVATPTSAQPFALVKIAKPAMMDLALPTNIPPVITPPTDPQAPVVLPTPDPTIYAEIVGDAPAPGYSNNTQYDAPPSYNGNKYILIDISEQHMYVYEGDTLVYSFVSSTGMNNATRTGSFSVLDKIPNAYGATWDIWMPNWLGIYWAGSMENGIHALPILPNGATLWAGYLGVPISYGCVVLGTYEAQLLYDWADIGTPVEIQW